MFKNKIYKGNCLDVNEAGLICENCGWTLGGHIGEECISTRKDNDNKPSEWEKANHASTEPPSIEETLAQRGKTYGSFEEHARITQNIKNSMRDSLNWSNLPPNMKEALEMNAHKVGRILNGDPYYKDSWHDIVGYMKLVDDELK